MSESHTDAGASGRKHSEIPPELWQLASFVLDRLDPAVKLLAARAQASSSGKCEQVWCPVCAVVALISGEEHPLINVVAEHSAGLLALAKAMLDNFDGEPNGPPAESPSAPDRTVSPEPGRYEHITVVLKDTAE